MHDIARIADARQHRLCLRAAEIVEAGPGQQRLEGIPVAALQALADGGRRFVQRLLFWFAIIYRSRIRPSTEKVTTFQGMNLPLFLRAVTAACSRPPQQGTSIRRTVTLLMSLLRMISVSFSL